MRVCISQFSYIKEVPMKDTIRKSLITLLAFVLALSLCACGVSSEEEGTAESQAEAKARQEQEAETEPEAEELAGVVTMFDEIDTEGMSDQPLQMESVTLFDDGSVRIVPLDDLLRNGETNNEIVDGAMYPFEESGKVKQIYLVRFGEEGYRTIIALMDDGTLSALSGKELIEDRIAVVMDNMTGRDNYVSIEQVEPEDEDDAYGVIGITEDDKEIELDFSLNF